MESARTTFGAMPVGTYGTKFHSEDNTEHLKEKARDTSHVDKIRRPDSAVTAPAAPSTPAPSHDTDQSKARNTDRKCNQTGQIAFKGWRPREPGLDFLSLR